MSYHKSIKRNYNTEALNMFYNTMQNKIGKIRQDIIDYYITLAEF